MMTDVQKNNFNNETQIKINNNWVMLTDASRKLLINYIRKVLTLFL